VERFPIAIVPVGRIDAAEVEAAAVRTAKVLGEPVELREALPVPHDSEDPARGQHRAAALLGVLRAEVAKLRPGRMVGGGDEPAPRPPRPAGFVFVSDVDLFTANRDGVFSALLPAKGCAVVSVRRLREAFYRRKADPVQQRSRFVKEILRMAARLRGVATCNDPRCVLAESRAVPDLDLKEERFCRACEQRLFQGRVPV